ncbi:hypothetical protein HPP92_001107 [Vanilla planifolia]|uniref:DOG1 domain-containing protein n=1 Tax=Vanilla planifolia TaxID=51239 RepID=A0A835RQG6_VANPL|nr:hypothetical protein HPP92_001107 [Vanilla planifolia]
MESLQLPTSVDQELTAYLVELEKAIPQKVCTTRIESSHGYGKDVLVSRNPTLEMLPTSALRILQQTRVGFQMDESSSSSRSLVQDNKCSSVVLGCPGNTKDVLQQERMGRNLSGALEKVSRRLAQNREAARKSRLKKKAYIQQLECCKTKLQQLEHNLLQANSQVLFLGRGANPSGCLTSRAALFDMEYGWWLKENHQQLEELRGGLQARLSDDDLRMTVDACIANYQDLFRLKAIVVKADVFHLLAGQWRTPAERCFLWVGGFRPSELLKMIMAAVDSVTEQQLMGICSLQLSVEQAEEELSRDLEQLLRSLTETLVGNSKLGEDEVNNASCFVGQMSVALFKLTNLEGFVIQADKLRQQTLHHLCRTLTVRQAARCFLAIGEYSRRWRALSSLWASRPRRDDYAEGQQMLHQSLNNRFPPY